MRERAQLNPPGQLPPGPKIKLVIFDFDGVFTDNMAIIFQDGTEAVTCCRADGIGLEMLKKSGIDVVILSSEKNVVVSARAAKLGVECVQGEEDKLKALVKLLVTKNVQRNSVAYVGNDINDMDCMKHVGVPIAVNDADYRVKNVARYVTEARGGEGAVREVCEMIVDGAFDEIVH